MTRKALAMILVLSMATVLTSCSAGSTSGSNVPAGSPQADSSVGADSGVDYGPNVKISIGTTGAAEDISTESMKYMQKYLSNLTGGAMTIELFPSSQLGSAMDMMEMVGQGSLDILLEGNYISSFGVKDCQVGSILFLNKSREMYKTLNESDLKAKWEQKFCDVNGIKILNGNFYRNGTCYVSNKKINSLADMAGVKIRVPQVDITIDSLKATGASPTPIAYSESLLSLQQNIVDAIWCTEDAAYTMGFSEVAKYLIELNTDFDSMYLYMNNDLYSNKLTDNQRKALEKSAEAAAEYYTGLAEKALTTNLEKMKASGVEVVTLSDDTIHDIWEKVLPTYYEMEKKGTWSSGLLDQVLEITGQK
jgi:TRAP-type C4-dicarboxylate transport system substrate-binding protein